MSPVYGAWGPYGDHARKAEASEPEDDGLETLIHRHRRLVSDMWHCACGLKINNEADHTNHVAAMVREGQGA